MGIYRSKKHMQENNMVQFGNYGNYSSDNYGVHCLWFQDTRGNTFYFSYKTLVAFEYDYKTYVRQNDWSTTTGKHLNWIDKGNKKERLTSEQFKLKYKECFGKELKQVA